eukprot:Tbor_TRINITY_DN5399_c2_g3::TRINITY_DN5399_c2_g3_i3::g.4403::m.4403/K02603/ORC1; origin recognition complex subunit 1
MENVEITTEIPRTTRRPRVRVIPEQIIEEEPEEEKKNPKSKKKNKAARKAPPEKEKKKKDKSPTTSPVEQEEEQQNVVTESHPIEEALNKLNIIKGSLERAIGNLGVCPINPSGHLLGRENHVKSILKFLEGDAHYTLQLFGMPGTGKTAAVKHAVGQFSNPSIKSTNLGNMRDISVIFFNGYILQRSYDVFTALLRHLAHHRLPPAQADQYAQYTGQNAATILEKHFKTGWNTSSRQVKKHVPLCVIVIDEVDKCCENSSKTLFRLVDWLTLPHVNCKMITIANAMHLPEQLDAKTRSRLNTTNRVVFRPYTSAELEKILKQRLSGIREPNVFSGTAMEYISKQVGLHYGDSRRMLQICAGAVHEVLRILENLVENSQIFSLEGQQLFKLIEVNDLKEVVDKELSRIIASAGIMKDEYMKGVVMVSHISKVARNVLHDRFPEFIDSVKSPFSLLIILIIANETLKIDAVKQAGYVRSNASSGAAERTAHITQLGIDRVFQLVKSKFDANFSTIITAYCEHTNATGLHDGNDDASNPFSCGDFGIVPFVHVLETLRQVGCIELMYRNGKLSLENAKEFIHMNEPVYITVLHPVQDIMTKCESHPLYKIIGAFFRRV